MDFAGADQLYNELKQEYEAGILTAEAFDEALRENMVQDAQDRWWAKGRESGGWHYYDEDKGEWIQADPPGYQASTAPAQMDRSGAPDQRQSSRLWMVAGVIAVALLGLGLGAYLMTSQHSPSTGENPQTSAVTSTAELTSVVHETAAAETAKAEPTPSPTPSPSATPTETPTVVVIASPTPSPSPTPTAVLPPPSAQGMVEVNIGSYTTTVPISDELSLFWIDQYEVTNSQYADFVKDTGIDPPDYWTAENIPAEKSDHPVEGISWQLAAEYCTWVNKRLPTEAEWEVAARGPHGWVYPWGNDGDAVQLPNSGTYAVGTVLANRSFFGAYDMVGNVWEWVTEPYLRPDNVESGQRVIRGGSSSYPADLKTPLSGDPDSSTMSRNAGIRCAADQVAEGDEVEQVAEGDDQLTLLYTDDFTDLTRGWPQVRERVETYFYGYHPTDFYHIQIDGPDDCLSVPRELDFMPADFMLEHEAFVFQPLSEAEGNFQYGVILRQQSRNEFYAFVISPRTQHWQVLKSSPEGMAVMAEGDHDSIRGDQEKTRDKLFVIANGPRLTFFINGELVADLSDDDYTAGYAGLITETFDITKVHVHNDTFVLWKIPLGAVTSDAAPAAVAGLTYDRALCRGYFSDAELILNFTGHTVLPGENLTVISKQYGTTIDAILKANDIADKNRIRSGWSLVIPLPAPEDDTS